eukprot:TRINITY_DN615_c0_g3_i1.p1 TRINITY_DN615_c0_g3~~TRINITY_DN615_c0_g3_i1.p1  ORF type:complete len:189 (-),score=71.43 TRINITY_DN615_c0_g3_i1:38-604(-)
MATHDYDRLFRIKLVGDRGVGKTCLLHRFIGNAYAESYSWTIGVDFKDRTIELDTKRIKLQIWDAPTTDRFKYTDNTYYRGAHGFIIVYDVTDQTSFSNVKQWLQEIERYGCESANKMIIGNKCDSTSQREVDFNAAREFSDTLGIPHFETSAKNSTNVEQAIIAMVTQINKRASTEPKTKPEECQIF